ncbi:hypothetical protein ANCDUO_05180 [Ancylostoma duodenale]|uniref:Uncharacterized protein n=1 Tax=Ancylostoma duodenale TaxID=51022 RepID=A0A0C2D4S4_9BILA|nr:hypothetical protein ANCDUO_05180 [Ancylostoma duodenale]
MRLPQRWLDCDLGNDQLHTVQKQRNKQSLIQKPFHRDMLLFYREDGFSALSCIDVWFYLDLMSVSPEHVLTFLIKVFCKWLPGGFYWMWLDLSATQPISKKSRNLIVIHLDKM